MNVRRDEGEGGFLYGLSRLMIRQLFLSHGSNGPNTYMEM